MWNIKGENHKHWEYSVERAMADLKVQTRQSNFKTKTRNQSKAVAIYFLAAINKLSRYEKVPPLVRRRVRICWEFDGAAVAMVVGSVEADLGG